LRQLTVGDPAHIRETEMLTEEFELRKTADPSTESKFAEDDNARILNESRKISASAMMIDLALLTSHF
jgi:hypothetical protein